MQTVNMMSDERVTRLLVGRGSFVCLVVFVAMNSDSFAIVAGMWMMLMVIFFAGSYKK